MKISIIIPVYRTSKYIKKCILSIISQSFCDFEIIFVNDGTDDDSCKIIDSMFNGTSINYKIINQNNKGVSSARNNGLVESRGEYVIFIDSDDAIASNFLEELYTKAIQYDADVSICGYKFVKKQECNIEKSKQETQLNREQFSNRCLLRNISFILPTMLIKKNILLVNGIKFNENVTFSEDQLFIWDVILNVKKIIYIDSRLYGYYLRPNSTMTGSQLSKIKKNIPLIKEIMNNKFIYDDKLFELNKYCFSRWKLGTLYTSAKILNYHEYSVIYKELEGNLISKELKGYKDWKASLLSLAAKNKVLFYGLRCVL